jgi:hypothetical protein
MKKQLIFIILLNVVTSFAQKQEEISSYNIFNINGYQLPKNSENIKQYNVKLLSNVDSVRNITEINTYMAADAYPWISPDGLRLYFVSGADSNRLMFTERTSNNNYFSPKTPVLGISPPSNGSSYWLSNNELDLYTLDGSILTYRSRPNVSAPFGASTIISLLGIALNFIHGQSLDSTQNELYLYQNQHGIQVFNRTSPTTFTYKYTLPFDSVFISDIHPGQLSKDGLTYLFSSGFNIGYDRLYKMTRTSLTDSFKISTLREVQGINDINSYNSQPSMANDTNCIAFVRAQFDLWTYTDLFIRDKGITTSVFNHNSRATSIAVFPNPSQGEVNFILNSPTVNEVNLTIFNQLGETLYNKIVTFCNNNLNLELNNFPAGLYFFKMESVDNKKTIIGTGKFSIINSCK